MKCTTVIGTYDGTEVMCSLESGHEGRCLLNLNWPEGQCFKHLGETLLEVGLEVVHCTLPRGHSGPCKDVPTTYDVVDGRVIRRVCE